MVFSPPQGVAKPRWVYFSFHYDNDVNRTQVVKQHAMTKGGYKPAGYFDGSLEELAKKESDLAVKRAINGGLRDTTVTCVLIGSQTYQRRWVHYEIFKSIERGNGLFGIRVDGIKDFRTQRTDVAGLNVFDCLGLGSREGSSKFIPYVRANEKADWLAYDMAEPIDPASAVYLQAGTKPILSSIFPVYDWIADNGYSNFGAWVAAAAKKAGK